MTVHSPPSTATVVVPRQRTASEAPAVQRAEWGPAATFAVAMTVAGLLAVTAGPALAVIGLVLFGALHNWFELRYLFGTFRAQLGEVVPLLLVLISGIVLCRLAVPGTVGRRTEIVLAFGVLGVAAVRALRTSPVATAAALGLLTAAAGGSLTFPDHHFVVLAHLHNVLPAVFIWHWARELADGPRRALRAAQVAWVLALPALVLAGAFDRWLDAPGSVPMGASLSALLDSVTPATWAGDPAAMRLLAVFAFMQTMHYVVWIWFLPRHDRGAARRFEQESRVGRVLSGPRYLAAAGACALLLAVVFWSDYQSGRSLYLSFTSYHAYLELPVVLLLLSAPFVREVLRGRA